MRRAVSWVLAQLPLEASERRAFDETLLDWAAERELAATRSGRIVADARGLVAACRTLVGSVNPCVDLRGSLGLVGRLLVFFLPLILWNEWQRSSLVASVDRGLRPLIWLTMGIPPAMLVLPTALFLTMATSSPARHPRVLALAIWSMSLLAALLLASPYVDHACREAILAARSGRPLLNGLPGPRLAGQSVVDLAVTAVADLRAGRLGPALSYLSFQLSTLPSAAVMVLLAVRLREAGGRRRWFWISAVMASWLVVPVVGALFPWLLLAVAIAGLRACRIGDWRLEIARGDSGIG